MATYKETRVCARCGRELPISKFGINKRSEDCLQRKCKDCIKKQYQAATTEKKNERFWEMDFIFKPDRDIRTEARRKFYSA